MEEREQNHQTAKIVFSLHQMLMKKTLSFHVLRQWQKKGRGRSNNLRIVLSLIFIIKVVILPQSKRKLCRIKRLESQKCCVTSKAYEKFDV